MKISYIIILILISFPVFADNNFLGKKYFCYKMFWGFDFISSNFVKVIKTDINFKINSKKYFYEKDFKLPYINLYSYEDDIKTKIYSIHEQTLRVDIWTMTSGGITTREIIPVDFCKEVNINNLEDYIKGLILNNH